MNLQSSYASRVISSALWSAYADALGFITELRDNPKAIYARIRSDKVSRTLPWKRRIGGRFGVDVLLLRGCYSDDTQLRLATCRAIRSDSSFNVEAFAKMELPVWTSYALGAGRGTKAAATSLAREGVTWFSNFYESDKSLYFEGGGNGAAMRIQPHVWAARNNGIFDQFAGAVVKNAICTHGHIRGILGAVFHAMCLQHARQFNAIPTKQVWRDIVEQLSKIADVVESDTDLRSFWLPVWEQRSSIKFRESCTLTQKELLQEISLLEAVTSSHSPEDTYRAGLQTIGALEERERGSGTKTALLAAFLADLFRKDGTKQALLCGANALSSDTDTIASMAGAIMGLVHADPPDDEVLDSEYIRAEAKRLAAIASAEPAQTFDYPNLLTWKPPRTQQDSVVAGDKGLEVLVLGRVVEEGAKFEVRTNDSSLWQWLKLESGQTVLAKRRKKPFKIRDYQQRFIPPKVVGAGDAEVKPQFALDEVSRKQDFHRMPTVHELTKQAIDGNFRPEIIGEHILLLSSLPDGIERTVAYAAIIAKARLARAKTPRS